MQNIKPATLLPTTMSRRHFICATAAATTAVALPKQSKAFVPFLFAAVRFGIGSIARGSVTRGSIIGLAASGTGARSAFAANSPRLYATANLGQIALRAPRKYAQTVSEHRAHGQRHSTPYGGRMRYAAQRAARIADLTLDGYDAVESLRAIATPSVRDKVIHGSDIYEQSVAAYYHTLNLDQEDAALAYWVSPNTNSSAFRAISNRWSSEYKIVKLKTLQAANGFATVQVIVHARENNQRWKSYDLDIYLAETEFGNQITGMKSYSVS